jgi:hypothetical protein
MSRSRTTLLGMAWGLFIGTVLFVFALVVIAIDERSFVRYKISLTALGLWYLLSGAACGAIAGILRVTITSRARAVLFGPLVVIPCVFSGATLLKGSIGHWDVGVWAGAVMVDLILGAMAGYHFWSAFFEGEQLISDSRTKRQQEKEDGGQKLRRQVRHKNDPHRRKGWS